MTEFISLHTGGDDWFTSLLSNRPPRPWVRKASCVGLDPEIFYPTRTGERIGPRADWMAKNICRGCEVRLECLQYAIDAEDEYGVHGGTGESHRRRWMRDGISAEEMIRLQDEMDKVR
jgi:WhiB family redox-sensing transcriptional regulator